MISIYPAHHQRSSKLKITLNQRLNETLFFRLFSYVGSVAVIVVVAQVVFICCVVYFLLALSRRLKREGGRFLCSFWNLVDVASVILSVVCIVLYVLQNIAATYATSKIKKLKGKH